MSVFGFSDLAFMGAVGGVAAYDPDAQAYITAVETADGQVLETAVRDAINAFVVGCKADGIWTAIKASCILAGASTLNGALVPLVGPAPTNNGPFVSGDYNRKTGLVGNGTTKYLDSNRNNNADPQNNNHNSVYATTTINGSLMGIATSTGNNIVAVNPRSRNSQIDNLPVTTGFCGISRNTSMSFTARAAGSNVTFSRTSTTPDDGNVFVFGRNATNRTLSTSRIAFYSIGESLDLALLDARVTALINAFAAAIP